MKRHCRVCDVLLTIENWRTHPDSGLPKRAYICRECERANQAKYAKLERSKEIQKAYEQSNKGKAKSILLHRPTLLDEASNDHS